VKRTEFFLLSFPPLRTVFVVFVLLVKMELLTCPFLEQKRVHTSWKVEHCDISPPIFPIIYLAKENILYSLTLFSTKGGNKRSFHGGRCSTARGMKKSSGFARARDRIRFGKNDASRKEEIKKNKILSDDRSTNTKHKRIILPAGDVSLGNSRVQANGLSNSLSNRRKHF